MKILIVQDYLRSGGTERQSILLANAFAAQCEPTTLLTFRPGGALGPTVSKDVRRLVLQHPDTTLDWFAPRLLCTIRRDEPDLILCMGRMANCYAGSLERHLSGVPVIATMRTGKRLPWLFRRSLQEVRHVVANSRDAAAALVETYKVSPAKISVIHNSLVFPRVDSGSRNDELRSHHGARPTTTILLCVAMFRPEKNQRELIEISAGFPPEFDWQLWLAGEGPARRASELFAQQNGLESRVRFLGFSRDPSELYGAADIAVHASASESLSNFLIEAQAHGLPVVAYDARGISETFVPDQTGWEIPRDDRTAFRQRIQDLAAESITARSERALQSRTFARTTFDPATQVDKYLQLFRRLIDQRLSAKP
jgi:glycosyltransferase involved in cell wall biosynthesis